MKSNTTKLQKTCDTLLQELNRKMNKKCLICSSPCEVGHHFVRKSNSSFLRYDLRNIIPLCNRCHCSYHLREDESFNIKIRDIKGKEWYESIEKDKNNYHKVNVAMYEGVKIRLEYELNKL